MRNTSAAYNLAQFAPQEQRRPGVRVVRTAKKKNSAKRAFKIKCVAYLVVLVALMVGTVVSQLTLTEIEGQITQGEKKISEMESANAYLNYQISNTAITNLDSYARDELGMVSVSPGQIEYVSLINGNQIESYLENPGGLQNFLDGIVQFFFGK